MTFLRPPEDSEMKDISSFEEFKDSMPFNTNEVKCEWEGDLRCITSDDRNVNMAQELNRIEKDNPK